MKHIRLNCIRAGIYFTLLQILLINSSAYALNLSTAPSIQAVEGGSDGSGTDVDRKPKLVVATRAVNYLVIWVAYAENTGLSAVEKASISKVLNNRIVYDSKVPSQILGSHIIYNRLDFINSRVEGLKFLLRSALILSGIESLERIEFLLNKISSSDL